jgi:hypothetical protein
VRIEFEVFTSLILKKIENHPHLYELWDHLLEKSLNSSHSFTNPLEEGHTLENNKGHH